MSEELTVNDVLKKSRKQTSKDARLVFKSGGTENRMEIEVDTKYCRLDTKKILPFEEYDQTKDGVRVKAKLVGYNRGEKSYFPAKQNEKGKWVADESADPVDAETVEKVIMDDRTGKVARKDEKKGMWFSKIAKSDIMKDWHIEEVYNFWSEDNSDSMLKIYEELTENGEVGVYKFNPNGTAYNGFLYPQRVDGGRFRLLLAVTRVKINKPEISPTMVIADANVRSKERERLDNVGTINALDEV